MAVESAPDELTLRVEERLRSNLEPEGLTQEGSALIRSRIERRHRGDGWTLDRPVKPPTDVASSSQARECSHDTLGA